MAAIFDANSSMTINNTPKLPLRPLAGEGWGEVGEVGRAGTVGILSRALRQSQTDAEGLLWQRLRNRQLGGFKFRRQHPFPPFIVDFVCVERKLIVEIDGGQHAENVESDERRTLILEGLGFRVLRFWNNEVLENINGVLESILSKLDSVN